MGLTPAEMYKLFFGSQEMHPELTKDVGLSCNRPDTQVSSPVSGHTVHLFIMGLPFNQLSLRQEWIAQAKLIRCPTPLRETTQDPVLIKMLEVAPSEEGEGEHRGTTTSAKEAFSKGGIESPSFQGEEDRFRRPGGQGLKAGKEICTGRSRARKSPGLTVSSEESAL